jgi:iron complex transport system ATP-binding protein
MKTALSLLRFMGCGKIAKIEFGALSQGERQRILIARALMPKPRLLVLDEPCVGLDMRAREEFLRHIGRLTEKGPTVVYVTHHIDEIVPEFTHALLIKGGRIVAADTKEKALTPAHLKKTFGMKVEVSRKRGRYNIIV